MKQSQHWLSIFINILLFMGVGVVWVAFAPAKIGGQTSYVMVNGISMEPRYHTGDLVIIRKAKAYQIGDVVTYQDAEMGAYVIHRVIGIEQGVFLLKGDNNSWIDAYHPTSDEIIGRQWIHAPKAGIAMQWFQKPINLSLTTVLLGGVFMSSMITKPAKGKKVKNRPVIHSGGILEGTLYLLGFLFLGFLGLSIFSFIKPLTRSAENIPYQQDGNYFYSAAGTPGVYDNETVRAGEPVFPKLTCFLNVGFTYNILGGQFQNVAGSHQMAARIIDEQSGWQRTIPMIPQTAFAGASYAAMAALDLCQLETLINTVEAQTGLHTNTYTIEIITNVAFTANAAGQAIQDTFDPTLVFKFDKVHLFLANSNKEIDPMYITKQGLAGSAHMENNTLAFLQWNPTIGSIRIFSLIGFGISLGGLALLAFLILDATSQSEEALIRLRHGTILIEVYDQNLATIQPVVDVTSIDDLAKMAERQNTMILHMKINFLHYYLVQGNGTTYRYVFSEGNSGVSEKEPVRQEISGTIADSDPYVYETPVKLQRETTGYVGNMGRPRAARVFPEDAEILRKIQI